MKHIKMIGLILIITTTCHAQEGFKGSVEPIPDNIAKRMERYSWHQGCPLPLSSMRYLTLTYWGFDHKPHEGHLIILNELAGETLQIFQALYQIKFPIEKMLLPEDFATKADNLKSIDIKMLNENSTSGFFCREDDQFPGQLSPHSYGIAIDINTFYNPAWVADHKIMPEQGKKYMDRTLKQEGMVDEKVVAIFTKHGWKWGGYFPSGREDYQHFQKEMDEHYQCPTLLLYRK